MWDNIEDVLAAKQEALDVAREIEGDIKEAEKELSRLRAKLQKQIHICRAYSISWQQIADALGVSKSAVFKRFREEKK